MSATLSGANRLPVSPRRRTTGLPPSLGPARHATYSKPFPIPPYLRHSTASSRFYTTPSPESPYSALDAPSISSEGKPSGAGKLRKKASLSDALRVGDDVGGAGAAGSATAERDAPILLPTCWDEDDRCALLELTSDGLGANFAGSAKYGDRDAAAVRANRPVPSQAGIYYFEITVLDKGVSGYVGIGLSHRHVSLSRLPGWELDSWGFHADDGGAFCCQGTGEPFGPTFTTGDVVGCGIDWTDAGPPKCDRERSGMKGKDKDKVGGGRVFYTKNGAFLGYAFSNLHGKLYPTVGLRTPNESVRVNFGAEPFRFDIESLVVDRKRTILSRIASTSLPSSLFLPSPSPPIPSFLPTSSNERMHETLQALISSYLVHHGYAATARAFARQITEERIERAEGLTSIVPATPAASRLPDPSASGLDPAEPADDLLSSIAASSSIRSEIRTAAVSGYAQRALELMAEHYPSALTEHESAEDGGVLFKLRCRVFVEAVLAMSRAPSGTGETAPNAKGKGKAEGPDVDIDMSCSDDPSLDDLLDLGRSLHTDYSSDPRTSVQNDLQATLGLMAYKDPKSEATGRARELLEEKEREEVADELNRAMLLAAALPPIPALEHLYRHAAASIQLAGDFGAGSAALVDVRKEVLEGL
ncbi:hypothetical protein JCM1841_004314 [Sporobolomyces salmonicolor]